MTQNLSAFRYIKNNKRRCAVLIVSLGLCFVMTYLTQFLLSTTEESFRPILLENTKKLQFIQIAGSSYGLDVDNTNQEEFNRLWNEKNHELAKKLETHRGIKKAYNAQILWAVIAPAVGNMTYEIPLVEKEEIPVILEHFGAVLSEGRLPENPGEIVLDGATMKNQGFTLNHYFDETNYGKNFKIVGIIDCSSYFGCGIPSDNNRQSSRIIVLSEDIQDISSHLKQEGIEVRENYDSIVDYSWGEEFFYNEITAVLGTSSSYIYVGIIILLSVSLLIVYTMYLRDRRNEWCLYCSIGYSKTTIYFSIIRELLFNFTAALLIGIVLIAAAQWILYAVMIEPQGLKCKYIHWKTIGQILCTYMLIFGILQIPVQYALFKIRTIDAMEDELYS